MHPIATQTVEVRAVMPQRVGVEGVEICAIPMQSGSAELVVEVPGTVVNRVRVQAVQVRTVMPEAADLRTVIKSVRQPTMAIQSS